MSDPQADMIRAAGGMVAKHAREVTVGLFAELGGHDSPLVDVFVISVLANAVAQAGGVIADLFVNPGP